MVNLKEFKQVLWNRKNEFLLVKWQVLVNDEKFRNLNRENAIHCQIMDGKKKH